MRRADIAISHVPTSHNIIYLTLVSISCPDTYAFPAKRGRSDLYILHGCDHAPKHVCDGVGAGNLQ